MSYQSVNPFDSTVLQTFETMSDETLEASGYARELSSMGIQEFVNKKLVRVAAIDSAAA